MGIRKDLSIFSQIVSNNSLLSKFKTNKLVSLYCKYVINPYIQFPPIDISNQTFFGYPKESYLEERFIRFTKDIIPKLLGSTPFKNKRDIMIEFLSSCHGGETLTDEGGKKLCDENFPEYRYYYYLLTKSDVISKSVILKNYPLLGSNNIIKKEYPKTFYYRPVGALINIECKNGSILIRDPQNIGIDFDFLRLNYNVNFKASLIISVKWNNTIDKYFFKNKEAKWIENVATGIKTSDIKIYIQKSNVASQTLISKFNDNGICCKKLLPLLVTNEDELKLYLVKANLKKYIGIVSENDLYVVKSTNRKTCKLNYSSTEEQDYKLLNYNISYNLVPENREDEHG